MNIRRTAALATALFLTSSMALAQEAPPTLEEMWAVIQRQQAEIEELRAQLGEAQQEVASSNEKIEEAESRIEATGDFVESLAVADTGASRTSIGSYGAYLADGSEYTANTAFGAGTQIGTGNYVVFAGTGTSVTVTGLASATTYASAQSA